MSGCDRCKCYERGIAAGMETVSAQEAAWVTYRENVDYSDGWRCQRGVNLDVDLIGDLQRWSDFH